MLAVLLLLLLAVPCQVSAAAASAYGFGGRRALLALRNIHASVYLEYQFDHTYTKSSTTTRFVSHGFAEELSVGGNYSLFKPEIWRGRYKLTYGGDQVITYRNGVSQGRNENFLQSYEFYSDHFFLSRSPVFIKSILTESRVKRKFTDDYYLWSETHSANMRVKNRTLPTNLSYSDTSTETSGLAYNRITDAQSTSLSISNSLKSISATSLSYTSTRSKSKVIELGRSYANDRAVTTVENTLSWPYGRRGLSLNTSYQYSEFTGENEGRIRNWEEALKWQPGRAFRVYLVHSDKQNRSFDVSTEEISNRGSLVYFLFSSLSLSLHLAEMDRTFLNGDQRNETISGKVSYKKNLYNGRHFNFSVEQTYEDLSRTLMSSSQDVLFESLIVNLAGFNFLGNNNVDPLSVVVQDETASVTYFEGFDYILTTIGEQTEIHILPGSSISDGDPLLISYSFLLNPTIAYTTDRTFVSSQLSLYDGDVRFSARYMTSDKEKTSGDDSLLSLDSAQVASIGMIANLNPYQFEARYTDTDTSSYQIQQAEASCSYEGKVAGGMFMLNLGDVYQVYHADESVETNRLSTRAIYRRRLAQRTTMTVEAEGLLATGDGVNRKTASVEADFDIRFRKVFFKIRVEERYLDYETRTSWRDFFMVSMRRNF